MIKYTFIKNGSVRVAVMTYLPYRHRPTTAGINNFPISDGRKNRNSNFVVLPFCIHCWTCLFYQKRLSKNGTNRYVVKA